MRNQIRIPIFKVSENGNFIALTVDEFVLKGCESKLDTTHKQILVFNLFQIAFLFVLS